MTELIKVDPIVINTLQLDDGVELTLHVPADLDYFNGHFDSAPILAGVVQLHWAVEFAKANLAISDTEVADIQVLKFQEVINPGQDLVLTLTKKSACKVLFSYHSSIHGQSATSEHSETKQHSSGRIVLAGAE